MFFVWALLVLGVERAGGAAGEELNPAGVGGKLSSGATLARVHCAQCHLFPEPSVLDRATWQNQTLPRMKMRMGLAPEVLARQKDAEVLKKTAGFHLAPRLKAEEFGAIEQYYLSQAPETALPQPPRPRIAVGLRGFRYEKASFRTADPSTTMVRVDTQGRRIWMGDAHTRTLNLLDSNGALVQSLGVDNVPVQWTPAERGESGWLTLIGHFMPTEQRLGGVVELNRMGGEWRVKAPVLESLFRTTDAVRVDLNGDGREDWVVCQYGNNVGHFSWFEGLAEGGFRERVLIPKTGALRADVRDVNGDGRPDITVLHAQETESLFVLFNEGGGKFRTTTVFQKHPCFGHTGFEWMNYDGQGNLDLLVTNGDNGEYPSPTKRYHGIRVYTEREGRWVESLFFPMNGAFKALARDFDADGDLDIAAISFYPDYENSPDESFVYLENAGRNRYAPRTFRECISGRWLTMDAGDVDGDGDLDLVLGSFIHGPTEAPEFLMRDWEQLGPSVVILRNQLK